MWCTEQNKLRTFVSTLTNPHVLCAMRVLLTLPCVATFPALYVATQVDGLSHVVHSEEDQPYAEVEVSCWQTHAVHAEIMSYVEHISC